MPNKSGFDIINNMITFLNSKYKSTNMFPMTIILTALFNNLTINQLEIIKQNNKIEDKIYKIFKPLDISNLQESIIKIIKYKFIKNTKKTKTTLV